MMMCQELPPSHVTARVSGSLTLSCSATGSPTPATAWYKDGHKLAGSDSPHPGDKQGLGEGVAKLVLGCITAEDGGVYECRAQGGGRGQEVAVSTSVEVVGHKPLAACIPRSLQVSTHIFIFPEYLYRYLYVQNIYTDFYMSRISHTYLHFQDIYTVQSFYTVI